MKCLFCQQETPTNTRTGRKCKYCSKRCANKYHTEQERKKHPNYGDPTWKNKTKIAEAEKAKRLAEQQEEFEWYKENWLTKEHIAELIGVTPDAIWRRVKKLNIKPELVYDGRRATSAFYNPDDIEKIKEANKNPDIPEGYLTSDEAIEWTLGAARGRKRPEPSMIQTGVPTCGNRNLYSIEDLDKWKKERDDGKKERQKAREDKIKQEQKIAAKKIAEFKRKTKGLITVEAAAALMGYKSVQLVSRYTDKLDPKKIGPGKRKRFYYDPNKVKQLTHQLEQEKLLETKQREEKKRKSRRKDDWTSVKAYENRFWKRMQKYGLPRYAKDTTEGQRGLNANKVYRDNTDKGIVTKLNCSGCLKQLPYTSFFADFKTGSRGRQHKCKPCFKKVKRPVNHNPSSPQQRMRLLIGNTIKQTLSKRNGEFLDMSIREIWDNIEKY